MDLSMRDQEKSLFQGDVTLLKSKLNVVQTDAVVTNQRLMILEGKQSVERADIGSVVEEKHGFTTKMVFRLRNGESIALTAANNVAFKAASLILGGRLAASAMPAPPKLSQVKNGTAWLAAVGPLLSGLCTGTLGMILWGSPEVWGGMQIIKLMFLRVVLIYLFLKIDHLSLQKQGYDPAGLGIADPIKLPLYLFSRAKAFGHGKAYAITWCVLVVIDVLVAVS